MIVISGQIKRQTMAKNYPIPLRQLGDQEVDIISMVKPITKYAVELQDPSRIYEVVDKAVFIAKNGRPGPVWIDVPMDVQGAFIDESNIKKWDPVETNSLINLRGDTDLSQNTLGDFSMESTEIQHSKAKIIIEHLKKITLSSFNGWHRYTYCQV